MHLLSARGVSVIIGQKGGVLMRDGLWGVWLAGGGREAGLELAT